ncbi:MULTISPECIES: DUF6702 family protein [Pseudoalteromonas]|uniref:Orphan protein n=1 Tax=Pseudoalteromonas luteoviolacea (strain 2ta16) TaxID=1353533 RepID=V4HVX6_PSEL2|nr:MULTISPECIES: DUF6702 family protein [Pseudoalteromonas]ESP92104.1 hypothetical protein PL2TA16_04941 [Pseudoalteromonas luteoviolacea 2ta16]KZN29208.1 hypothetical protein N483_07185 [Pseudoalteromonas luteoviolacea NCIMB 1944]MCG7546810.1 hypothetical protein [Pseudoalteromonas sp. Of7M-16]
MIKYLQLIITAAALLLSTGVFAHQQKAAETTVLFNKNSGQLEIMHRFYLHDTEHAVQSLFDKKADILNAKKTQQQFADYVAKHFQLKTLSDKNISLTNVGFEVEGKFFWVYQETQIPSAVTGIKMYNGSLRDLWPAQVNMVNVEGKGKVRTLYFSRDDEWLVARF